MKLRTSNHSLLLCILLAAVQVGLLANTSVSANADDPPIDVIQPEQLAIQLGTQWAGVEFQLKTDYGLYPGTIPVGSDGVLRLEIGGSSSYLLSCLGSGNVPSPNEEPEESIPNEPGTAPTAEMKPSTPAEDSTVATPQGETVQEKNLLVLAVLIIQSLAVLGLLIANLLLSAKNRRLRRAVCFGPSQTDFSSDSPF